jgi:hypothetical protein
MIKLRERVRSTPSHRLKKGVGWGAAVLFCTHILDWCPTTASYRYQKNHGGRNLLTNITSTKPYHIHSACSNLESLHHKNTKDK